MRVVVVGSSRSGPAERSGPRWARCVNEAYEEARVCWMTMSRTSSDGIEMVVGLMHQQPSNKPRATGPGHFDPGPFAGRLDLCRSAGEGGRSRGRWRIPEDRGPRAQSSLIQGPSPQNHGLGPEPGGIGWQARGVCSKSLTNQRSESSVFRGKYHRLEWGGVAVERGRFPVLAAR